MYIVYTILCINIHIHIIIYVFTHILITFSDLVYNTH